MYTIGHSRTEPGRLYQTFYFRKYIRPEWRHRLFLICTLFARQMCSKWTLGSDILCWGTSWPKQKMAIDLT